MKTIIQKDGHIINKYLAFFLLTVFILWMKTYFVQLTQFDLGVEKGIQQFLLFLNPLGSALFFLSFSALSKGRWKYIWLLLIYFIMTLLLYANVLYYRFFNDFITLPTLFQTQNFGDVSSSVPSLLRAYDVLFFVDFIIFVILLSFKFVKIDKKNLKRKQTFALILLALGISALNLGLAESDRPHLLTRGFDRNYIVKYLGMYNYTIYDAVQSTKASAQRVTANSDDITEVLNFTKTNYAEPNPKYFGKGEGKNVIFFHLESIQSFLMDYQLHGEEVTPFLNSLIREKDMMYFDNFFHQTAQGKTADAEFLIENSLYGLSQGSAFTTKGNNTYQASSAIFGQLGYTSAVFHPNTGTFWNRNQIYKSFGYDKFFDASYYDMDPEEIADYGLMDKPFFEQSVALLETLPQPFYTKFITVSHHFPYKMDQEKATIEKHDTGSKSVDNYFQTARYADEALEQFFNYLKESGLYDNSIIIMYGDHYGISENHKKAMANVLEKEKITQFDQAGLQRVPLFIHVPGMEGGVNHEYTGQVDVAPTLLHLLGIDTKKFVHLGTDILSEQHNEIVPFRNGEYVSPVYSYIDGKYYDSQTGLLLEDEEQLEEAKKYRENAEYKLALSDKVVNGDLLRFYTPEGFSPVDPLEFNYNEVQTAQE